MSSTNGSINSNDYQGRYINLSWLLKSQSVVSNNSVISWSLKGAGVGQSEFYPATDFKVVINGITVFSSSSSIDLYNGTVVSGADYAVIHNSDGTKTLEIEIEAKINGSIVRGSSSWELPEINRNAIITSCDNFTDIEDPRVSFLNPNNSTVRINLKANTVLIASRTETAPRSPYTIALTANERDLLRSQTPSSNSMTVIYEIETLLGAETVYTDQASATMRIVEADPTITGITYRDTNPDTIAITGIDTEIIEGNSLLTIDIDTMSAIKGANLARLEVTINGETKSIYLSGSSDFNRSVSIGVVNSSIDLIAEIKVIDTRGNSTTRGLLVDFLSWSLPSALISCNRQGNYFSNTDLTVNAVYSPLNNKNSLLIQYQYKESSSSTWSALVTVANNSTTTINLDNTKSYDIRVILTDLIGSMTYNLSVDIGTPIIFFDKDKRSVGINCLPQDQESLEVNGRNVLTELSAKVNRSELATVATTGDYNDLLNKPTVATIDDTQTTANNAWSALKIDNELAFKQNSTDQSLNTQDKTITGSINEVLASIPTDTSDLVNDSDYVSDSNYVHTDNNFSNADVTKLSTIESGAEVNVQSDWSQTDTTADDYIKNKPTIPDISTKVSKAGDTMTGKLTAPSVDISGGEVGLKPNSSSSNGSGDITFYYGNGQEKARIYTPDNPTTAGDSRLNFRSYASDGTPLQTSTKLATQADLGSYLNRRGYGAIASTDNLNNYNSTGTYWINGTRPTNSPTPSVDLWGVLEVYSYQSNIRLQRITQVGSTGIALVAKWVRFYINNAWQAWQKDNPYYEEQDGVSGCVSSNNTTVQYIKCIRIGKQVTCSFHFSSSTAQTGGIAYVALKSQFRPSRQLFFPVNIIGNSTAYTNESAHRMYLYTDGTLKLNIDNTNATVTQVMGSVSYCIN